jgi:hypothetical protein
MARKFTDKLLHHNHAAEHPSHVEDREQELLRSKERHVTMDDKLTKTHSTSTLSSEHSKEHSFSAGEKLHHAVDKVLPATGTHTAKAHHAVDKVLPGSHTHLHERTYTDGTYVHEHLHEHVHEHVNAPIVETVVRETIVEETVRRDKVVEVQPIIHRHVDAPEVHHVEKHVYEVVPPQGPARIVKQPVVDETIQPRITEDITTVLHREVPAPYVVHEEQHITEHQVQPVVHTKEVIEEKLPVVEKTKILVEERHTSDWENQTVDRCPIAAAEHMPAVVEKTTTTTTTTTSKPELASLERKLEGVSLDKREVFNQQGVREELSAPNLQQHV